MTSAALVNGYAAMALLMIGLYVVIAYDNLVKRLIGLTIFQTAVFVFYISLSHRLHGTAPILDDKLTVYSHPLPHVLILTAIVVGIATLALGLALVVRIYEAYGSTDEDEILEQERAP